MIAGGTNVTIFLITGVAPPQLRVKRKGAKRNKSPNERASVAK